MKAPKYVLLFLALLGFSVLSLGLARPSKLLTEITDMHREHPESRNYLVMTSFDSGELTVGEQALLCTLTQGQADSLVKTLKPRTRPYRIDGVETRILLVKDSPANRRIVERITGIQLVDPIQHGVVSDDHITHHVVQEERVTHHVVQEERVTHRVVQEVRIIPILTPIFVS